MTYQEAYDKIIEAYFKDEIQPFSKAFCICGTLSVNNLKDSSNLTFWWHPGLSGKQPYTIQEYAKVERALISAMGARWVKVGECEGVSLIPKKGKAYEDLLFAGMSAALDVLKEIHRERGEDVDNISKPFTKRQLVN